MSAADKTGNPPGLAEFLDQGLPLIRGTKSINFAVMRSNGLSSNSWGVTVSKQNDIYLYCRDHMQDVKVSLHQSGTQYVGFTEQSGLYRLGNRRWHQWLEAEAYNGPNMVPSFSLFFPSWGLGLTEEVRKEDPKVWDASQVYLPGAESPLATTISLVITNPNLVMPCADIEGNQLVPFGVLDVSPEKSLWLVARYEPEGALKELAIEAIGSANTNPKLLSSLVETTDDRALGLCVDGFTSGGIAFMMPFPVTARSDGESPTLSALFG